MFRSETIITRLKGSTINDMKVTPKMSIGDNLKTSLSAIAGMMSSLRRSLMPSAMDCAQPCQPPTRMGPRRSCICADTLRSSQMRNIASTEITRSNAPATCKSAMVYQGIQVHDLRNGKINSAIVRSNQATHSTTPASSPQFTTTRRWGDTGTRRREQGLAPQGGALVPLRVAASVFVAVSLLYCHRVGSLIHSRSRLPQAYANPT